MIFLSYSWHDGDLVRSFVRRSDTAVWIDYAQLDLSVPLAPQIFSGIAQAEAVVAFDSSHARESAWVRWELQIARLLARPVIRRLGEQLDPRILARSHPGAETPTFQTWSKVLHASRRGAVPIPPSNQPLQLTDLRSAVGRPSVRS